MSPTKADNATALEAWCPYCERLPGSPCVSGTGRERAVPHAGRVRRSGSLERGTLRSRLRPGESMDVPRQDAEQLPLVGYGAMSRRPWPKLSEQLPHPRDLDTCQACGALEALLDAETLETWEEHDEADRPAGVVVRLCPPCSAKIVEPHPRLYRQVDRWEPLPGVMELCRSCRHRRGVSCAHPDLLRNGGTGLRIVFPRPTVGIACVARPGGGRGSRRFTMYAGPPSECAGQEPE